MSTLKHPVEYEVTAEGRVFASWSGWRGHSGRRELVPHLDQDGYPSVNLTIEGKRKRRALHRLVAEKFLPPKPTPLHQIRHLDGDKMNSRASNLAWGTAKENADDRMAHGMTSRGDRHASTIKASNQAEGTREYRRDQRAAMVAYWQRKMTQPTPTVQGIKAFDTAYPGSMNERVDGGYIRRDDAESLAGAILALVRSGDLAASDANAALQQAIAERDELRARVEALEDALRPFANYACNPACGCHNCAARAAIAKATGQEGGAA